MSTINQCRACLEVTFSENSIFELNLLFNENTTSFIECFFQCTNIKISQDEKNLPQKMCDNCIQSVINMYQFRLMCQSNDLQLKPKVSKKEDFWEADYLYNVPKLCKKPFFYEMDEIDEFDEEISPENEIIEEFTDSVEDSLFPEEIIEQEVEYGEVKLKFEKKKFEKVLIKCKHCKGTYFRTKPQIFKHKLTEHSLMSCIDCDEEFTTHEMDLFQEHSKIHSSEYVQNCNECKETFTTAKEINKHDCRRVLKIVESELSGFYPCKYCEKKFLNEIALNIHLKNHLKLALDEDEQEEYTCTACNIDYKIKNDFTQHMRIVHVLPLRKRNYEKTYKLKKGSKGYGGSHLCPICGQSFKLASYVKTHLRIHNNERPYNCNFCDKKFRQSTDLKYHTISMHGVKKHQCTLCDKKFVHPTNLKTHMRSHTNERPFSCDLCEKSFTTSSGLHKHKGGVHLMSMKKCEFCGLDFSPSQYRIHLSKHTGIFVHNCELCDYKTNRKYMMTLHMEKKHSNVKIE